jgi:hypothetical protein
MKVELHRISSNQAFTELMSFIETQCELADNIEEPEGPEWAFQRAFHDGQRSALKRVITWVRTRSE